MVSNPEIHGIGVGDGPGKRGMRAWKTLKSAEAMKGGIRIWLGTEIRRAVHLAIPFKARKPSLPIISNLAALVAREQISSTHPCLIVRWSSLLHVLWNLESGVAALILAWFYVSPPAATNRPHNSGSFSR
jgi:hypothetical protein